MAARHDGQDGISALHKAAQEGRAQVVGLLLEKAADVNLPSKVLINPAV